jgi:hypothetical protein
MDDELVCLHCGHRPAGSFLDRLLGAVEEQALHDDIYALVTASRRAPTPYGERLARWDAGQRPRVR